MPSPIQFRLPHTTTKLTPLFGIPKGTFGRGIYEPECIILHSLRMTLDSYYSQVSHPNYLLRRDRAQPLHSSLHYGVGYDGEVHRYVNGADLAWGLYDYDMAHFPAVFPEGNSPILDLHPGISPDYFAVHIGAMSGMMGGQLTTPRTSIPMSQASLVSHARLVAWLCHTYDIPCTTSYVVKHETVDLQFVDRCIGDDTYPYAAIMSAAQAIIAAGGELDVAFDAPILHEYVGVWTVGISRVGSMAYLRYP